MNRLLRRRHFRWWLLLSVLLPILMALGLAARPEWPASAPVEIEAAEIEAGPVTP